MPSAGVWKDGACGAEPSLGDILPKTKLRGADSCVTRDVTFGRRDVAED